MSPGSKSLFKIKRIQRIIDVLGCLYYYETQGRKASFVINEKTIRMIKQDTKRIKLL